MNIKKFWSDLKNHWMLASVITIVLGLILLLFPGISLRSMCYLVGGFCIAFGVIRTVHYFQQTRAYPFLFQSDLLTGLISLGLGLFMITHPEGIMGLIPALFGILLVGYGIGNILRAVDAKKSGFGSWGLLLALAILSILLGVVILNNPFSALETILMVIGAGLIYEGAADIFTVLLLGKRMDIWKKNN